MSDLLRTYIQDFWEWWVAELRMLLELPSNGRVPHSEASTLETAVVTPSQDYRIEQTEIILSGDGDAFFTGRHLKLHCSSQRVPFSRLSEIARIRVRERTPFSLDQVHVIPGGKANGVGQQHAYVVKKNLIDPMLAQLTTNVGRIDRLGIPEGAAVQWLSSRTLEDIHPAFHHTRYWRNFMYGTVVILLMALGATYAYAVFQYSAAEQVLSDLIETKRTETLQVRKLLDQQQKSIVAVEAARKGKNQAVPLVRIWEELTRVLPDDTWLTDVSLDGGILTVTGFAAQSAAGLIATLDASSLFSEPSFTSPVVRIPGQTGERFEIRLLVHAT